MKVRILSNSLRFRLKQPEVSHFYRYGKVTEILEFGPDPAAQLRFVLEISAETHLTVGFQSNTTTIGVPREMAEAWTLTELVGFDGKIDTGQGSVIEVLVEKDFRCLDGRAEDNEGAYPNPLEEHPSHCAP
jgi:hypothetical protein